MKITVRQQIEVRYVRLSVPVRYDEDDMPYNAPLRIGDQWEALIDIDNHLIVDWPKGRTLEFYMKVTDEGDYDLLDGDQKEVASIDSGYVPNYLLPGEFGDYLELKIDADGQILNWLPKASLRDFEEAMDR